MATVPVLPALIAGGPYPSSSISAMLAVQAFLLARPVAELRQATTQSIPATTWTSLAFDAFDVDTASGHSNVTLNSRYVAQYAGWYVVGGGYNPLVSAVGGRGTRWAVNGTPVNASSLFAPATAATGAGYPARVKRVFLNQADYIELQVYQSTAGALGTDTTGDSASSMTIGWDRNS